MFPDATGTVITTGNPEDLETRFVKLKTLTAIGVKVGLETSPVTKSNVTIISFDKYTTLMLGSLKIINEYDTKDDRLNYGDARLQLTENFTLLGIVPPKARDIYTSGSADWLPPHCTSPFGNLAEASAECRYCAAGAECSHKNEILIPDVSGTVITTGNLAELPSIAVPFNTLRVAGKTLLLGDITLGTPAAELLTPNPQTFTHPAYLRSIEALDVTRQCDGFEVCWRVLTDAHGCSRMLTYADVC
jgi:hypothetical protein